MSLQGVAAQDGAETKAVSEKVEKDYCRHEKSQVIGSRADT